MPPILSSVNLFPFFNFLAVKVFQPNWVEQPGNENLTSLGLDTCNPLFTVLSASRAAEKMCQAVILGWSIETQTRNMKILAFGPRVVTVCQILLKYVTAETFTDWKSIVLLSNLILMSVSYFLKTVISKDASSTEHKINFIPTSISIVVFSWRALWNMYIGVKHLWKESLSEKADANFQRRIMRLTI